MSLFDDFNKKLRQPPLSEVRVRVYDVPTRRVTTIPARELAPGMVRVTVNGIDGECWVSPDQLQKGAYQHPPFTEEIRAFLSQIQATLNEVYPMSLEEWEDGFRRDTHAEREIAVWLHIATIYSSVTLGKPLQPAEKQDIFRLLVACANNPREQVWATAGIQVLSRPEAEAVILEFYSLNQPGERPRHE